MCVSVCVFAQLCEKDQMAGWGSEEGGARQDVGRAKKQREGIWEGLRLCSLALPWCMNAATTTEIFEIIPIILYLL